MESKTLIQNIITILNDNSYIIDTDMYENCKNIIININSIGVEYNRIQNVHRKLVEEKTIHFDILNSYQIDMTTYSLDLNKWLDQNNNIRLREKKLLDAMYLLEIKKVALFKKLADNYSLILRQDNKRGTIRKVNEVSEVSEVSKLSEIKEYNKKQKL